MADYVFGFCMYGVANPFSQNSTAPVLYIDGVLDPADPVLTGLLPGVTLSPRVVGRPGVNWGADPRNPVGSGQEATVTLLDDEDGTMGTLFLHDIDSPLFGVDDDPISAADTSITVVCGTAPTTGVYYLGDEAVQVTAVVTTGPAGAQTHDLTLVRARCGSLAHVHVLSPSEFSPDEDGSADRIWLTKKPIWENGFYCGVYLFKLDQFGAIESYILRRGVVEEEPTHSDWPHWEIKIKWLEDRLADHTVGALTKEVTLTDRVIITELDSYGGTRANKIAVVMDATQAKDFFNTSLGPRGSDLITSSKLTALSAALTADAKIQYQLVLAIAGDTWVYKINGLAAYAQTFINGVSIIRKIKLNCSLVTEGYAQGATVIAETYNIASNQNPQWMRRLKPWWVLGATTPGWINADQTSESPPTCKLRLKMRKTVTKAFLLLACSIDGTSGGTYDKIIGRVGAGLPQSFFSLGAASGDPLSVLGNTTAMLEIDELLDYVNSYYFDLTQGVSLRDFLTNEFIASQLLLGSLQSGLLALKSWVHEVASSVTLNPLTKPPEQGKRLSGVTRLDLSAGIRILDLEPTVKRSVRFAGATKVTPEETQAIRFWRDGMDLSVGSLTGTGDLAQLVNVFRKILGGRPFVYPVECSIEDHLANGVEFGDAVSWSNTDVVCPTGRGISGEFFVVGIDLDYDSGICHYKLIKNTLFSTSAPAQAGTVAPVLDVTGIGGVSGSTLDLEVKPIENDHGVWDPSNDYNSMWEEILNNGGKIKIENYTHAPSGELERVGSIESTAEILAISTRSDGTIVFQVDIGAQYARGEITTYDQLITLQETKIILPDRQPAQTNLIGTLVEADGRAKTNLYAQFDSPKNPVVGVTNTFSH